MLKLGFVDGACGCAHGGADGDAGRLALGGALGGAGGGAARCRPFVPPVVLAAAPLSSNRAGSTKHVSRRH